MNGKDPGKIWKRNGFLGLCVLCAILCLASTGCDLLGKSATGKLTVKLSSSPLAKNLVPDVDLTVASYDIHGDGPGDVEFSVTDLTGSSYTIDSLIAGGWFIQAKGKNEGGTIIVESEYKSVTIVENESATVTLSCIPIIGATGTLSLNLSWPVGKVSTIVGALSSDSGDPIALEFGIDGDEASCTVSELDNGYYTLSLKLFGAGEELAWSWTETVLIYTDLTTRGVWNLTEADFEGGNSGVALILRSDTKLPLAIALQGGRANLIQDDQMEVSASGVPEPEVWQWYFDGDLLEGETSDRLTIGGGLLAGSRHSLVAVGKRGDIAGSAGFLFSVVTSRSVAESEVPDPVLRSIFADMTGKDFSAITTSDLLGINKISKNDSALTDLTGIELCSHLQSLGLARNNIRDISALPKLKELISLNLKRNPVQDYSPIGQLHTLHSVKLSPSSLNDLEWLTPEVMPELKTIGITPNGGLGYSHALAVQLAAFPLVSLEMAISLSNTSFEDFYTTALYPHRDSLLYLDYYNQSVLTGEKVEWLANLSSLEWLNISYSPMVHNIDFLATMTSLTSVLLSGDTGLTDLSPLKTLYDAGGLRSTEDMGAYVELFDLALDVTSGVNKEVVDHLVAGGVEVVY